MPEMGTLRSGGPKPCCCFFFAGCYIEDSYFRRYRFVTVLYRAWYELHLATTGGAAPERVDFAENKRVVSFLRQSSSRATLKGKRLYVTFGQKLYEKLKRIDAETLPD